MPGATLAQEDPSPIQAWIDDWLAFLSDRLPLVFVVVAILVGIVLIVKAQGGIGKLIAFGLGAALVFLLLTNLEAVADLFGEELPIDHE